MIQLGVGPLRARGARRAKSKCDTHVLVWVVLFPQYKICACRWNLSPTIARKIALILDMTINSLFRVPCILVAMVGINTTSTPPVPPPRSEESAPSTMLESVLKQRFLPLVVKVSMNLQS